MASWKSDRDPLNLIEGERIAGAVVQLGGAGRFVRGNGLGVLDGAAVFQVGGDAGGAEGVAADAVDAHAAGQGAALDHPEHVGAGQALAGEGAGLAGGGD